MFDSHALSPKLFSRGSKTVASVDALALLSDNPNFTEAILRMSTPNCHLEEAIHRAGGVSATARALGVSRQAVFAWKKRGIPATRVRSLTELVAHTVTPEQLRPDIFEEQTATQGR